MYMCLDIYMNLSPTIHPLFLPLIRIFVAFHCIWVIDVFEATTNPVNLHGVRGETAKEEKNPKNNK